LGDTSAVRFAQRHRYPLAVSALIVGGVALRLALILIGWPHGNSEEGTMGLEAMHILLRGERPVYFYGQNYMGVGEAYLGALAFWLFGVSTAALRLGMLILYTLFMVGVFWLADLLYSRRVALMSLAALALGTPFLVQIELLADGGKAETMAFGALMFALAAWLALSREAAPPTGRRGALRYAAFAGWGLCAGLGLYTYAIIAPLALTSGLLLWLSSRREWRGRMLSLVGLLLGLLPAILYTATMPFADNPIAVFFSLHQSLNAHGASGWYLLVKQVDGALLYTLPAVTGLQALYPVSALPLFGPPGSATALALIVGGGWSLAYLLLLGVATYRPLRALRQRGALRLGPPDAAKDAPARDVARALARLLLAGAAWLTIGAYTFSATAANNPHSGRYMIGLLVSAPAVLWPLVDAARGGRWRTAGLALLGVALILGAGATAQSIPQATHLDRKDARFASDLLSRGITRFYSDYWTCDLLNFNTRERLTCAVVNDYAQPGLTRYYPYADEVRADPSAPYVLPQNSTIARTFALYVTRNHLRYTVETLDGYFVLRVSSG